MGSGKGWAVLLMVVLACGPELAEDDGADPGSTGTDAAPEECGDAPYDAACEAAFAQRCEIRSGEDACLATPSLGGGVSLQCAWLQPQRVTDLENCTLSPAEPRCVGIAYPGDIGCSSFLDLDGDVLLVVPEVCFPIGWGECSDNDAPPECSCLEF